MKYALDTNVFVDSFHREDMLVAFLERALPFTFMSAVVMQELAAGARTRRAVRALSRSVVEPFERRKRVFAPSSRAFVKSGRMFADLARGADRKTLRENPSPLNDALLAASCREHGITLITKDTDFDRLAPLLPGWHHVAPWPELP